MKKGFCLFILMITLAGCSFLEGTEGSEFKGQRAEVLKVIDGDTIKVKLENGEEERVRMTLIDTPETKHPQLKVQPFGIEASEYNTSELLGKKVVLELDVQERDQYGRVLAYVWHEDVLFNKVLLEKGLARVAVFPPNTKYVDQFKSVEQEAKKSGYGIWSIEDYVLNNGYNTKDSQLLEQGNQMDNAHCKGKIKGNRNSKIYHKPTGKNYDSVSKENIIWFCTEEDALEAGFRAAKQ